MCSFMCLPSNSYIASKIVSGRKKWLTVSTAPPLYDGSGWNKEGPRAMCVPRYRATFISPSGFVMVGPGLPELLWC